MSEQLNRRCFIGRSAAAGAAAAALAAPRCARGASAAEEVTLAVMGTNGRGSALAAGFTALPGVRVATICDVDERAVAKGIKAVTSAGGQEPRGVADFRRALDDPAIDAVVCATPNHWHAPATILACAAGKHVYVEKPCSHNPREGELMVAAARKHRRVVTMGTQRRSSPLFREAIEKVHGGAIGPVRYSRSWYNNRRGSIGRGKQVPVPSWLDFDLWQGPAPEQPYVDNLVHYNWHWRWHWGNGELGNNGVHSIDISRWGLGVDYPLHVTSGGGRYRHDDDQESPDTQLVSFQFPDQKMIVWEGVSWSPRGSEQTGFGISFHGDEGTLVLAGDRYTIYDTANKEQASEKGGAGQREHLVDFVTAIREGSVPNAEIAEAHKSTLLCHLGNIAHRTGRALRTDPADGHIEDDAEAMQHWSRAYRKGWEPVV